jgi:hypothetical protein
MWFHYGISPESMARNSSIDFSSGSGGYCSRLNDLFMHDLQIHRNHLRFTEERIDDCMDDNPKEEPLSG